MKYTCLLFISFFYVSLSIDISVLNGDKLFNKYTPIIVNLLSKDTSQQTSNVDLICVIDISGSMTGEKILLVKESLKKLISLMTEKDRISIVLFNHQSFKILDLFFLYILIIEPAPGVLFLHSIDFLRHIYPNNLSSSFPFFLWNKIDI